MIVYPDFDPQAFSIGAFSVRWYGICYLAAFLLGYWQLIITKSSTCSKEQVEDLVFYVALGVILGGRIGYILFYYPRDIFVDPLTLLKFWLPGRSFHGGLLGVLVAIIVYAKKTNRSFLDITDFITPIVPIGIFFGRIGNFINGELWGRVTNVPWGMVFRHVDVMPRHPSQLYEAILEGIVLFIILRVCGYYSWGGIRGFKSGVFLSCYALFRIFIECYREPDLDQGFSFNMTMGQILSIPMLVVGLWLVVKVIYLNKNKKVINKCGNI